MILTDTYVFTRVVNGATLTNQYVAGLSHFSTINFHAKTFAFRFTTVLGTTYTFFMCHDCVSVLWI